MRKNLQYEKPYISYVLNFLLRDILFFLWLPYYTFESRKVLTTKSILLKNFTTVTKLNAAIKMKKKC